MDDRARARSVGFDAAQVALNTQGGHLAPEDRLLFDAAIDAAMDAVNYQGAVELEDAIGAYFSGRYPLGVVPTRAEAERALKEAATRALDRAGGR